MKYLVGIYVATVLIAAICFDIWGQYAYKGFFYNLGRAFVWPAIVFPSVGAALGGLVLMFVIGAVLLFGRRTH